MTLRGKLFWLRVGAWLSIALVVYAALLQLLGNWSVARAAGFAGLMLLALVAYRFALRFVRAHHEEPV